MKKEKLLGILAIALVFGLIFTGCPQGNNPDSTSGQKATAPFITTQPTDYQPALLDQVTLKVAATVSDGGTLSYQWYKANAVGAEGTVIPDATTDSYAPRTDTEGKSYYYVGVSNSNLETRTTTKSRYATVYVLDTASAGTPSGGYNIVVDTSASAKHQFVRGFGGMINAWGAPCPDLTVSDVETLFNPDKLGLNILRMIIYPEPLEDIMGGLVYTSIDNSDLFDIGKTVNKYGGMIIGCPWTPPDGLKLSNGHLDPDHYRDMSNHLVTWVKKMEAGMGGSNKIFAISSQNEPDSNASWCIYTPDENRDFVKSEFPYIRQQIPHVKLFPGEYTAFNENLYKPIIDDSAALAAIDGFAGHIYGAASVGGKEWATDTGKELWMTEHLRNTGGNYNYDPTWAAVWDFADDFHNCMLNGYNAYVYWYAKRFYGLIGDSEPGVTNQKNGTPSLRGILMSHYSKYAAGKYRYDANWVGANWTSSAAQPSNIRATAYMDDATYTVVMFNTSQTSGNDWINIRLPAAVTSAFAIVTYNEGGASPTLSAIAPTTVAQQPTPVVLSADKKTASVKLPPYSFLSIKFYK